MKSLVLALVGWAVVATTSSPAAAQAVWDCTIGQRVVDARGTPGLIVAAHGDECLIKYLDGRTHGWVPWQALRAEASGKPAAAPPALVARPSGNPPSGNPPSGGRSATPPPKSAADAVAVVRPTIANRLVYQADPRGHVLLTAAANGAPVRFMVDTGASLVFLTPKDARAAGIKSGDLKFNHTVQTGNGPARAAPVLLREIRIGELAIEKVQAAVIESQGQSVLGMSFLSRLKGFEMRGRVLTIDW